MSEMLRPAEFQNIFGRFHYRRVPERVYPVGIERVTESGLSFLIASPTKAVCDRIALEPRIRSMSDVKHWAELMRPRFAAKPLCGFSMGSTGTFRITRR